jgi:hypothetical protein
MFQDMFEFLLHKCASLSTEVVLLHISAATVHCKLYEVEQEEEEKTKQQQYRKKMMMQNKFSIFCCLHIFIMHNTVTP